MIGSVAIRVSTKMKTSRTRNEVAMGTHKILAEESPRRNRQIEDVYNISQ
jgi:hypothetical protein